MTSYQIYYDYKLVIKPLDVVLSKCLKYDNPSVGFENVHYVSCLGSIFCYINILLI